MPPKKAAKKLASKHPEDPHQREKGQSHEGKHPKKEEKQHKKDKKKHAKKHKEEKHLRCAYEHLGRLSAMEKLLSVRSVTQIKTLTNLAQQSLVDENPKSAADLLRAAEHLAFGSLAQTSRATRLTGPLEASLNAELEHLTEKCAEHWQKHEDEHPPEIVDLYSSMLGLAEAAGVKGAYRRALEFARAAEALAHVRTRPADDPELPDEQDGPRAEIDMMDGPE